MSLYSDFVDTHYGPDEDGYAPVETERLNLARCDRCGQNFIAEVQGDACDNPLCAQIRKYPDSLLSMNMTLETTTLSTRELHTEIDDARSELLRAKYNLSLYRDPTYQDYHTALEALNNAYQRIEYLALEIREAQDRLKNKEAA